VSVPEQESFFVDARVELLLRIAGNVLGLPDVLDGRDSGLPGAESSKRVPWPWLCISVKTPPLTRLFWKSKPFSGSGQGLPDLFAGWRGLLNMVSLETELCAIRAKAQKVQVMTLHGAKGLEFEVVFSALSGRGRPAFCRHGHAPRQAGR
jgi:hypothetical protein